MCVCIMCICISLYVYVLCICMRVRLYISACVCVCIYSGPVCMYKVNFTLHTTPDQQTIMASVTSKLVSVQMPRNQLTIIACNLQSCV